MKRTATGVQCGIQVRPWPFGTTDLAQKEIATAITNGKSGRAVLLTVLKAGGWRLRSLSTLILLMRQGNHPEGPCVGKGDTGVIELLCGNTGGSDGYT